MSPLPILQTLSYNLRRHRAERGLSQAELAASAKITTRNYQSIEVAKANPSLTTINSLAQALQVTAGKLLSLDVIRIEDSPEKFVERFNSAFFDASICTAIRTLDGVLIHRNPKYCKTMPMKELSDGKVDLYQILPPGPREVLRNQIASEKRGFPGQYVNFKINEVTKEVLYFRFYPCLVFPKKGMTPLFAAIYAAEFSEDCEKNYYQFCEKLLNCVL